ATGRWSRRPPARPRDVSEHDADRDRIPAERAAEADREVALEGQLDPDVDGDVEVELIVAIAEERVQDHARRGVRDEPDAIGFEGASEGDPRRERQNEIVADRHTGAEHPVDVEGEFPRRTGQPPVDVDAAEEGDVVEGLVRDPDAEADALTRRPPRAHEADVSAERLHEVESETRLALPDDQHGRVPRDLRGRAPRSGQGETERQSQHT